MYAVVAARGGRQGGSAAAAVAAAAASPGTRCLLDLSSSDSAVLLDKTNLRNPQHTVQADQKGANFASSHLHWRAITPTDR